MGFIDCNVTRHAREEGRDDICTFLQRGLMSSASMDAVYVYVTPKRVQSGTCDIIIGQGPAIATGRRVAFHVA